MNSEVYTEVMQNLLPSIDYSLPLYHYTSGEGLLGIVNSKEFHCSHIFFLNDLMENLDLWNYYFPALKALEHSRPDTKIFKELVNKIFDFYEKLNVRNISSATFEQVRIDQYHHYVFSFSEIEDDLSQWRAYSPPNDGYCMEFNFSESFFNNQPVFRDNSDHSVQKPRTAEILLSKCIYSEEEKIKKINTFLNFYLETVPKDLHLLKSNPDWMSLFITELFRLGLFFKDKKFEAEREVRMVITPRQPMINDIKFKKGKFAITPYINISIFPETIKGVMVGPTLYRHHSVSALNILFRNANPRVNCYHSSIPFRY